MTESLYDVSTEAQDDGEREPAKPKVCLETTIPSYLTSRPSRDLLVAAHQQITSDWWNDHRHRFSLVRLGTSPAGSCIGRRGRGGTATRGTGWYPRTGVHRRGARPGEAFPGRRRDSSKVPGRRHPRRNRNRKRMDYLATWNRRHIVNAEMENWKHGE